MNSLPNRRLAALCATLVVVAFCALSCEAQAEPFRLVYLNGSEQYDQHGGFGGALRCVNGTGDQPAFLLTILPADDPACSFEQLAEKPVEKQPEFEEPDISTVPSNPPQTSPIPEPETLALIGAGLAFMAWKRRRSK